MKNTKLKIALPLLTAAVLAAAPRARADWSAAASAQALVARAKASAPVAIVCADWAPPVSVADGRDAGLSDATLVLDGKGRPTAKYRLGSDVVERTVSDLRVARDGRIIADYLYAPADPGPNLHADVVVGRLDSSLKPVLDDGYFVRVDLGGTIDADTGADRAFVNACVWGPAPAVK
ncbi:MAG TPA: hypothetical protein VH309_01465 [Elusimicrobiota bacterium]|nr:hypothetical protein [Elusimicrobiota bacterium]